MVFWCLLFALAVWWFDGLGLRLTLCCWFIVVPGFGVAV